MNTRSLIILTIARFDTAFDAPLIYNTSGNNDKAITVSITYEPTSSVARTTTSYMSSVSHNNNNNPLLLKNNGNDSPIAVTIMATVVKMMTNDIKATVDFAVIDAESSADNTESSIIVMMTKVFHKLPSVIHNRIPFAVTNEDSSANLSFKSSNNVIILLKIYNTLYNLNLDTIFHIIFNTVFTATQAITSISNVFPYFDIDSLLPALYDEVSSAGNNKNIQRNIYFDSNFSNTLKFIGQYALLFNLYFLYYLFLMYIHLMMYILHQGSVLSYKNGFNPLINNM